MALRSQVPSTVMNGGSGRGQSELSPECSHAVRATFVVPDFKLACFVADALASATR